MSKRQQEFQGGGDRYPGMAEGAGDMNDAPKQATAAQMARRKIAQARKPSGSQRSSRAGTPTGNVFAQGGQSMPSFQPGGQTGTGFGGGDFNFAVNAGSNPFAQTNGASATPPPTSFQFGTEIQPNGMPAPLPNAGVSFGSTFGSAAPQQNGFNSTSTIFSNTQPSNANNNTTSSIFSSFGQNNQSQSQQNGITPSTATTSSFPSFGKQNNTTDNPFKGFAQTESSTTPSFGVGTGTQQKQDMTPKTPFVFGQTSTQAQPNGEKPMFGSTTLQAEQTPKTTSSNVFSGFGQQNQAPDKPLFAPTPQTERTPKPSATSIFTSQQTPAKGLFGSTPPPDTAAQSAKPGESIFNSLSKKDGISSNMFTQSRDSTPKPTTNMFAAQQSSSDTTSSTPKPGNLFGGLSQAQSSTTKPNLFAAASTPAQSEQQTPKPANNVFGGTFGQPQPSQTSSTPVFSFGQSQHQDTSMTTPGNTPQKPSDSSSQQPGTTPEQSSNQGKSLFDRVTPRDDAPSTVQKNLFSPSTTLFNGTSSNQTSSNDDSQSTPAASGASLFDRATPRDPPATAVKQPSSTSATSSTNTTSAAPWLTHGPSALTTGSKLSQPPLSAVPTTPAVTSTVRDVIPEQERNSLKVLNEGLKAHLAKQDPNADWTSIVQYYAKQAADIRRKPEPKLNEQTQSTPKPPTGSMPLFQPTPKPTATSSSLEPPQTAPINRKRPAEDDVPQPPATEKRSRPNEPVDYPKLPENASETSKLFQAALNRTMGGHAAIATPVDEVQRAREERERVEREGEEKAEKEKRETEEKQKKAESAGGFKPSGTGFTPSVSSGMPTFSAPTTGSGGFLAAFGKKATDQEEKDRKKRKAEDYDSDEETEEAWLARDKAEQEAKRQKVLAAAKSGAAFTPSSVGTPAPESDDGQGFDEDVTETPAVQGGGLFDRVTPREPPATAPSKSTLFSAQTPFAPKTTSNLFGSKTPSALGSTANASNIFGSLSKPRESIEVPEGDKTEGEKEQGTGDNTWKPNTPIKFGASTSTATDSTAAPSFGSLFGTNGQKFGADSTGHLSVPKPSIGFNFGVQPSSLTNSRATTPGFTTDGEGASTAGEGDGDEDDAPPAEPQVEDQTGLRDSEKENEDVLFQVSMAKASKFDEKKNDAGEIVMGWVEKAKGPLYILKNKHTGKARVMLKVPPYGVTKMNFAPLKDMLYEVAGAHGKIVQGVFIDHLERPKDTTSDAKPAGSKFSKWLIQVKEAKDAKEIARILMEERAG